MVSDTKSYRLMKLLAIVLTISFLSALSTSAAETKTGSAHPSIHRSPRSSKPYATPRGAKRVRKPDVRYVPTPQAVVDKMLELAKVKEGDVLYDLGCGDGRITVTAAKKYGVRAVGIDIDPAWVKVARANVKANNVEHLVKIKQGDIFRANLRPASVVTLYLLPRLNVKLMPQLSRLRPGSRIVSHMFDMAGAKPEIVHDMLVVAEGDQKSTGHRIYMWTVPWQRERR